jgi:DNA-binding transcriptional regulator of glucitol operon
MNKYRKFITSAVGFTFVVVGVTGVIFKLFFKNHPLEQIHGWLGLALVAAAIFHIAQNWAPLRNHFRDRRVFLILIPVIAVIACFALSKNQSKNEKGGRGPNPRAIIGRLSHGHLNDVAKALGTNPNSIVAAMKAEGLTVENGEQTVEQLAENNHQSSEGILTYFAK